ncbi:hypothetical protein SynSYN20_01438 [Synechococcus sp. SYN20]|nr:hypothetical protein SynSYN20_01438 [Synechococcus sp. SYN20]
MFILADRRSINYIEASINMNQREKNEALTKAMKSLDLKSFRDPQK